LLPSFQSSWAEEMACVVRDSATPCLVLRELPQSDSVRLDCLAPGTKVTAIDSKPYWREVRLEGGREGWVAKKFLELDAAVPEAQPPFPSKSDAWLEVHFVDVGQCDGIWIHRVITTQWPRGGTGHDVTIEGPWRPATSETESHRGLRLTSQGRFEDDPTSICQDGGSPCISCENA
jgi:hypothetical protein